MRVPPPERDQHQPARVARVCRRPRAGGRRARRRRWREHLAEPVARLGASAGALRDHARVGDRARRRDHVVVDRRPRRPARRRRGRARRSTGRGRGTGSPRSCRRSPPRRRTRRPARRRARAARRRARRARRSSRTAGTPRRSRRGRARRPAGRCTGRPSHEHARRQRGAEAVAGAGAPAPGTFASVTVRGAWRPLRTTIAPAACARSRHAGDHVAAGRRRTPRPSRRARRRCRPGTTARRPTAVAGSRPSTIRNAVKRRIVMSQC